MHKKLFDARTKLDFEILASTWSFGSVMRIGAFHDNREQYIINYEMLQLDGKINIPDTAYLPLTGQNKQNLMDALWKDGIRPSKTSLTE